MDDVDTDVGAVAMAGVQSPPNKEPHLVCDGPLCERNGEKLRGQIRQNLSQLVKTRPCFVNKFESTVTKY